MKILLLLLLLSVASLSALYADHFVGHDAAIINIKDQNGLATNNYKIRVKLYHDQVGIGISGSITGYVYHKAFNTLDSTLTLTKVGLTTNVTYSKEDCYLASADFRLRYSIFESAVFHSSAFPGPSDYYFVSGSDPIITTNLTNIASVNADHAIYMEFKGFTNTFKNNTVEFKKHPADIYCVGKVYNINWDIIEPDGDSLVYSIAPTIYLNTSYPFPTVPFKSGYGINLNVMDGSPDISISGNGIINFMPTIIGNYLITIKVYEYRKISGVPTKISEIRRDLIFSTIVCDIRPPTLTNNLNNQKGIIVDTLYIDKDYLVNFTANDTPIDSLRTFILPNISLGENILDPNMFGAQWGAPGQLLSGGSAMNLVIAGVGSTQAQFKWKPRCAHVRPAPYTFTIVTRDNNCPEPYYDSTKVFLYVKKKENKAPMFTSPALIKKNDNTVLRYNLANNEVFSFSGNTAIKTYDADSAQTVVINMIPDPNNGADFNNSIFYTVNNAQIISTASFSINSLCKYNRTAPYIIYFEAIDNDCYKRDTTRFTLELYINENVLTPPSICAISVDFSSTYNTLYWNDIQNVDLSHYTIYRQNSNTGSYDSIARVEKAANLKYNDYGFTNAKPSLYKIAASSHCGVKTVLSAVHSNVVLKIQKVNNNINLLSWNSTQGAVPLNQKLYRSINNGAFSLIAELPNTTTSFLDTVSTIGTAEYLLEIVRNEICYSASANPVFSVYSNSVTTLITSIDVEKPSSFNLYPNPTSDFIHIKNSNNKNVEYVLMDVNGKIIQLGTFTRQTKLSIHDLANGMYLLRINADGESRNFKILKD